MTLLMGESSIRYTKLTWPFVWLILFICNLPLAGDSLVVCYCPEMSLASTDFYLSKSWYFILFQGKRGTLFQGKRGWVLQRGWQRRRNNIFANMKNQNRRYNNNNKILFYYVWSIVWILECHCAWLCAFQSEQKIKRINVPYYRWH